MGWPSRFHGLKPGGGRAALPEGSATVFFRGFKALLPHGALEVDDLLCYSMVVFFFLTPSTGFITCVRLIVEHVLWKSLFSFHSGSSFWYQAGSVGTPTIHDPLIDDEPSNFGLVYHPIFRRSTSSNPICLRAKPQLLLINNSFRWENITYCWFNSSFPTILVSEIIQNYCPNHSIFCRWNHHFKGSFKVVIWLVVWNIFYFSRLIGNVIIPIDSYFSEG